MPAPVVVVILVALSSVAGFVLVTRFVPERWLIADADASSAIYSVIAMAYTILVALGAIAVWEARSDAAGSTEHEAIQLVEAHWSARDLAEPDRGAVRGLIVAYTQEVIEGEWPMLRRERAASTRAEDLLTRLRARVEAVEPADEREAFAQEQVIERINEAADARRARISAADEGMPSPLWPILIGGGIVSITFLYLFGLARTFPNGLMMFFVGGMLAVVLAVIYQLEFPFSRGLGITPDPFRDALLRQHTLP